MEQKPTDPQTNRQRNLFGAVLVIGAGVGVAIGAALGNVPVWTAIGVALGAVGGFVLNRRNRSS